jgi:hypothetical protein
MEKFESEIRDKRIRNTDCSSFLCLIWLAGHGSGLPVRVEIRPDAQIVVFADPDPYFLIKDSKK